MYKGGGWEKAGVQQCTKLEPKWQSEQGYYYYNYCTRPP